MTEIFLENPLPAGTLYAFLDNVLSEWHEGVGIRMKSGVRMILYNSRIIGNATGVYGDTVFGNPNLPIAEIEATVVSQNGTGLDANGNQYGSPAMSVAGCHITQNNVGIQNPSGVYIRSRGNNTVFSNAGGESFMDTFLPK